MEWIPLVAALLAIPALVWGIIAAVRQQKRYDEEKAAELAAFGFYPLVQPDPAVVGSIIHLLRQRGENLVARSVYAKQRGDFMVYLLDVWMTGGKQSRRVEEHTLAAVSGRLSLPRFSVFPRLASEGIAARLANATIRRHMARAGTPLDVSGDPALEGRYVIATPQEQETRRWLNAAFLSCLGRTEYLRLEALNDTLVLHQVNIPVKYRRAGNDDVKSLVENLLALAQSLGHAPGRALR